MLDLISGGEFQSNQKPCIRRRQKGSHSRHKSMIYQYETLRIMEPYKRFSMRRQDIPRLVLYGTSNRKISVVCYVPHFGVSSGCYVCYISLTYLCITYMGYIGFSGYFLNCNYWCSEFITYMWISMSIITSINRLLIPDGCFDLSFENLG